MEIDDEQETSEYGLKFPLETSSSPLNAQNPSVVEIRRLTGRWTIPNALLKLKECHQRATHPDINTLFVSSPFANQEIIMPNWKTCVPQWRLALKLVNHIRGQDYISLHLCRVDSCGNGLWTNVPVTTMYQFEILTAKGETICQRVSAERKFYAGEKIGWSPFAKHSDLLKVDAGTDNLIIQFNLILKYLIVISNASPLNILSGPFSNNAQATTGQSPSQPPLMKNSSVVDNSMPLPSNTTLRKKVKRETRTKWDNMKFLITSSGQTFIVNAGQLAARSKWFLNYFTTSKFLDDIESRGEGGEVMREFGIRDENPELLKNMFEYIHRNNECSILTNGTFEQKVCLLYCAFNYEVDDLKWDVFKNLVENINVDNVIGFLLLLHERGFFMSDPNAKPFIVKLQKFILANSSEIAETDFYQTNKEGSQYLLVKFLQL